MIRILSRLVCGLVAAAIVVPAGARGVGGPEPERKHIPCGDLIAQFAAERSELDRLLARHHSVARVDGRAYGLPENDLDDATNLTIRQRREFRALAPDLEYLSSGPLQYPRWAFGLMYRLDREKLAGCGKPEAATLDSMGDEPARTEAAVTVHPNLDASNDTIPESETYVAIDPHNPQYMLGASNIDLNGRGQMMYHSADYGSTWGKTELVPTRTNHSDPWAGFDSAGNAYSATLDYTSSVTAVKLYRSADHGVTWPTQIVVDDSAGNDKELATIDNQADSACRDQMYVGWDNGKAQYVSSTTAPNSGVFRPKAAVQSKGATIACDLAVGPPPTPGGRAPAYTVWTSTSQKQINVSKTGDCGASWSTYRKVASTVDSYDYGIPAQCNRRALIYPSIDVDRSTGTRRGLVYVAWNDFTAAQTNGCVLATDSNHSNVWLAHSADGGVTWSAPVLVHANLPRVDHFNQWMHVDDTDGTVHVMWRDTRNDSSRKKTDIYYTKSVDGGATFMPEVKVTSVMSDETTAGASPDQYGDYEGLAAFMSCASPFWTDRRTATPEEIYTAEVCP
jgi:hypothetical protein